MRSYRLSEWKALVLSEYRQGNAAFLSRLVGQRVV